MKNSLMLILLFGLNFAQGQFDNRYNLNLTVPSLRDERCNSGIRTTFNFAAGNPASFYYAAIGDSYSNVMLGVPPNGSDRMRFILEPSTGMAPIVNKGYQFSGPNGLFFNTTGNSIAEVNDGAGAGGYVAVGSVSNNPVTGANGIAGGSDALLTHIDANGVILNATSINVNNGRDVASCIRRSSVVAGGAPTYIMCGQSQTAANNTDCFVARVRANGTIVWLFHYRFANPGHSIARQLCEDAAGNIYVVGTVQNNQNNIDGLAFRLTQQGVVTWAENYHAGSDDEFQSVRLSQPGNSIVIGGFTNFNVAAPVTHNMLFVRLATANGAIMFQNELQALANNGVTIFTSKCYDIVEAPGPNGPEYFLAGLVVKNNINYQMMYKVGPGGSGINWYAYHEMNFTTGFQLDKVGAGISPDLVYFSSMQNTSNASFSDSDIQIVSNQGSTCKYCGSWPPSNMLLNRPVNPLNSLRSDAYDSRPLTCSEFNYDWMQICNANPCMVAIPFRSASKQPLSELSAMSGSIKLLPNPVVNTLHVQFNALPSGEYRITLTDLSGRLVLQRNSVYNNGSSTITLDVSAIPKGVYGLTVSKGEVVMQQKMVKQ